MSTILPATMMHAVATPKSGARATSSAHEVAAQNSNDTKSFAHCLKESSGDPGESSPKATPLHPVPSPKSTASTDRAPQREDDSSDDALTGLLSMFGVPMPQQPVIELRSLSLSLPHATPVAADPKQNASQGATTSLEDDLSGKNAPGAASTASAPPVAFGVTLKDAGVPGKDQVTSPQPPAAATTPEQPETPGSQPSQEPNTPGSQPQLKSEIARELPPATPHAVEVPHAEAAPLKETPTPVSAPVSHPQQSTDVGSRPPVSAKVVAKIVDSKLAAPSASKADANNPPAANGRSAAAVPSLQTVGSATTGEQQQSHGQGQDQNAHADHGKTGQISITRKPAAAHSDGAVGTPAATEDHGPAASFTTPIPAENGTPAHAVAHDPVKVQAETRSVAATSNVAEPPASLSLRPRAIDIRVGGPDNKEVDVRVSQRAGDVEVTVRTPDSGLAQSLRDHLPELSDRLNQTGVQSDIWHAGSAHASSDNSSQSGDNANSDAWRGQQQDQRQQQQQQQAGSEQQNKNRHAWWQEINQAEKES